VMRTWGQITGRALLQGRPVGLMDSLFAATAITHGLILATRNARDVASLPVRTVDPWAAAAGS
jgi:predicted nucleic acid-binding protein